VKFRSYKVSELAIKQARGDGLCGSVELRVARMARRATPITSEYGNWRFHDWFMTIEGDMVTDVIRMDLTQAA
jgi:hypothetical protein